MTKENKQEKLNIYQKLVEVRKVVKYIKKDAKGYNYQYATESDVLSLIRPKMDELGLVLEVSMEKPEMINDKITQIGFIFTWINADNPAEQIEKRIYLQDLAGDPKKLGGLLTYANRYFLYKYFNIATDKDDLDAYQSKIEKKKICDKLSVEQIKEIKSLANNGHFNKLLNRFRVANLELIPADKFDAIIQWLNDEKLKKENEDGE